MHPHNNSATTGLAALTLEMDRQHDDAITSFSTNLHIAEGIADALRDRKRLLLLGMGASHWLNRMVEPLYRRAGIDATASVISEHMRQPPLTTPHTQIIVSQSGASGEIIRYLDQCRDLDNMYGLTLNPDGELADRLPSLLGTGGVEVAFAATRSLLVSMALHGTILDRLGHNQGEFITMLSRKISRESAEVTTLLKQSKAVIFSGRGVLQGVAEAGALCFMELARTPALALEGGQLLHGPCEILNPQLAVILLREKDDPSPSFTRTVNMAVEAGCRPVVLDLHGGPTIPGTIKIDLPCHGGLAAAALALTVMQSFLVQAAAQMVSRVGEPLRSTKITDGEAG